MIYDEQTKPLEVNAETEKYENEKKEKKQRLVRNEFQKTGKYEIPLVRKQNIDLDKTFDRGVKAV